MKIKRTGIGTSVTPGIAIPEASRTNAIVGCLRKSTAPTYDRIYFNPSGLLTRQVKVTKTVVASAPTGIRFKIASFVPFFRSSCDDV